MFCLDLRAHHRLKPHLCVYLAPGRTRLQFADRLCGHFIGSAAPRFGQLSEERRRAISWSPPGYVLAWFDQTDITHVFAVTVRRNSLSVSNLTFERAPPTYQGRRATLSPCGPCSATPLLKKVNFTGGLFEPLLLIFTWSNTATWWWSVPGQCKDSRFSLSRLTSLGPNSQPNYVTTGEKSRSQC